MLNTLRFSWRLMQSNQRSYEWYILLLTLIIAISAITATSFYTDQLKQVLHQQSVRILGGDIAVVSPKEIDRQWLSQAQSLHLRTAEILLYPSTAYTLQQYQLVNIQAVSKDYPLIKSDATQPPPSSIWVEPRLLAQLHINIGDSIMIGDKSFPISGLLSGELQTINTNWVMAPRIMMRLEDVAATKTVVPGSRVEYRILLTGEPKPLQQFQQWLMPQLQPGQQIITLKGQQNIIDYTLRDAETYLQLTLMMCILMAGVVIALCIKQYLLRHYAQVALWRCLGLSHREIAYTFILQFAYTALLASAIGIGIGFVAQSAFTGIASDYITLSSLSFSWQAVAKGILTSCFLLFAFAMPTITELPATPPLLLFRQQVLPQIRSNSFYILLSIGMLLVLFYWIMDFTLLTLLYIDVILISIGFLYLIQILLISLIQRIMNNFTAGVRQGLSNLIQQPETLAMQFIGLTLVLMAMMTIYLVQARLLTSWQSSLAANAPNYFAFNIASNDVEPLKQLLIKNQVVSQDFYPMVRGRLTELNQRPIFSAISAQARRHNALRRELNISWMWQYPTDNVVVEGNTWKKSDTGKALVSLEASLSETLGVKIGDELTFHILGQNIKTIVSNIRTVDWAALHPNFYVIFVPGLIENLPATFITSFYLAPSQTNLINQIISAFPNVTVIDIAKLLSQAQELVSKVTIGIQVLFTFSLLCGMLLIGVSVLSNLRQRRQASGLLHTLGADKHYLRVSLVTEFACMAVTILATATLLAYGFFELLSHYLF